MSSEFDRSPQQRGGEGIGREDQDVVTAHVAINGEVCIPVSDEWKEALAQARGQRIRASLA